MTDNENDNRQFALAQAVTFGMKSGHRDEDIVKAAETFYAFLSQDSKKSA